MQFVGQLGERSVDDTYELIGNKWIGNATLDTFIPFVPVVVSLLKWF